MVQPHQTLCRAFTNGLPAPGSCPLINKLLITIALVFALPALRLPAAAAQYYVDANTGDDARSGTSPALAWKTLDMVNRRVFRPGDEILFRAGTSYTGQLKPQGSGVSTRDGLNPIRIDMYDNGPYPRFDGAGLVTDTLLLRNVEYWDVAHLEITNLGTNRQPWRTGVHILSHGYGALRHIHLDSLSVHDVNGELDKKHEGCGIYFEASGDNGSHFEDLLIQNCRVVRTDRNGICQRGGPVHSRNVIIRQNLLEDIGGDGIKLWGTDGGLIDHNILRGGRKRCDDGAAGIWPFDCDDTVIQYNEVTGMHGTKDGQGFDSDYGCHRSVFQYNYSHDNDGGFMLVCSPGSAFNEGTIIRYNISQYDGLNTSSVIHLAGNSLRTLIYNNTIYVGPKQNLPLLAYTTWLGGNADQTFFYNNIFYVEGRVAYDWGHSRHQVFAHNVYYGQHQQLPPDPYAVTKQPPLAKPGSGGSGLDSLEGYLLHPDPMFPKGQCVPANGGQDFFGHPVPPTTEAAIGASEVSGM